MAKVRINQFMGSILNQWYGTERGRVEMTRFTPPPESLRDLLERIESSLIPPWQRHVQQLRDSWSEIVGAENARRCRVVSYNEGVLYIEVLHPMYRMILETPQIKNGILKRIQEKIGAGIIQEIRFVMSGRSPGMQ